MLWRFVRPQGQVLGEEVSESILWLGEYLQLQPRQILGLWRKRGSHQPTGLKLATVLVTTGTWGLGQFGN